MTISKTPCAIPLFPSATMHAILARLKRQLPQVLINIGITVLFLFHAANGSTLSVVNRLENILYDSRVLLTMPGGVDPRIAIVDIDEKSLAQVGHWPWSRNRLADLVNILFDQYQVVVVGFDIFFPEPDENSGLALLDRLEGGKERGLADLRNRLERLRPELDYDQRFAESLKNHPVFLGYYFKQANETSGLRKSGSLPAPEFRAADYPGEIIDAPVATGYGGNLPLLVKAATSGGHVTPAIDEDGVVRRVPLLYEFEDGFYGSLAMEMARYVLAADTVVPEFGGSAGATGYRRVESLKIGFNHVPVDDSLQALVPYRGFQGSFPYISAADVLAQRVPKSALQDTIVIVGTTAPGLYDLRTVPVQKQYPGVEVHANLLAGILDNTIKQRPAYTQGVEFLTLFIVGSLLAIALPLLSPVWASIFTATVTGAAIAVNLGFWQYQNLVLPLASTLLMILLIFLASMSWGFFFEQRLKRRISGMFGQYVPPELVEQMSDNPGLVSFEAESKVLTVLFTDVRSFTTISEKLTPGDLSRLMNLYLTAMTRLIHKNHGTIDKYMGDAIMAFWGAPVDDPEHARHAMETGQQMLERLNAIREDFEERGWPPIHIGVGINTGVMSVGDMGSEFRRAYTVMGDAVNLGSRLEGLTKSYGVEIIVSEFTRAAVPDYVYRELDVVKVKGKAKPVAICEPLAIAEEVSQEELDEIEMSDRALGLFRAQQWDAAEGAFRELKNLSPERKLYDIYLERIAHFRADPPGPDWDGVYTFTTK